MNKKDTVIEFLNLLENADLTSVRLLDDNFKMDLPSSISFGQNQFLTFMTMIRYSIPDLKFITKNIVESSDKVSINLGASGSYQNGILLPGLEDVPANGQNLNIPPVEIEFIFLAEKIKEIKILSLPKSQNSSNFINEIKN